MQKMHTYTLSTHTFFSIYFRHTWNILPFYCIKYDFPHRIVPAKAAGKERRERERENESKSVRLCNGIGYPSAPVISVNHCKLT